MTDETCRGKKITYADAIFESPARKMSAVAKQMPAAKQRHQSTGRYATRLAGNSSATRASGKSEQQQKHSNNNQELPDDVTSLMDTAAINGEELLSDNEAANLMDADDLVYDCSECDYRATCGDDLLEHYTTQHADKFLGRDHDVIMSQRQSDSPSQDDVMVKGFLHDSVEGLHDYMNDQELE